GHGQRWIDDILGRRAEHRNAIEALRDMGNALTLDVGITANLGHDLTLLGVALRKGGADLARGHESFHRAADVLLAGLPAEAARRGERDRGIRSRGQTLDRARQAGRAVDLD